MTANLARCRTQIVTYEVLPQVFRSYLNEGFRITLVACHEDTDNFRIVYVLLNRSNNERIELILNVAKEDPRIPSLADQDFAAGRFEREILDMYGVVPVGHPLPLRIVRHAHWPESWHPMLKDANIPPIFDRDVSSFPFLEVEGDGVFEIPVGPVHAGIIEPGHFRFSVMGETILRMKARLWFVHRGVEKLLEGADSSTAVLIAERISGDTSIGHSLALVLAMEEAAGICVSEPDLLIRALLLELERMYNHVTDIGALANDVGFGLIQAHALRLRESLLRLNAEVTGNRLLRGAIHFGGSRLVSLPDLRTIQSVANEVETLATITLGNATVRDRFFGTSILDVDAARRMGVLGYVARASNIDVDARRDFPFVELGENFTVVVESGGDVMSRYQVRVREFKVSAMLVIDLTNRLGSTLEGNTSIQSNSHESGLGLVEGWRGLISHRIELDSHGKLARAKIVDPSFFNWPALSIALNETIVPDFPLTNKSFNQSYAGNDL